MALRSNLNIKKTKKKGSILLKVALLLAFVLALLVGGFILYFNGENVKAPLINFLKERTSLSINCKQVEYSPLYPNIIKIKDLSINDSHIDEIYAEFDLTSIIKSKDLEIKYLYLKKAQMQTQDLQHISNERFGFENFKINKFELVDSPFKFSLLDATGVNATLDNVTLDEQNTLSFTNGKIMATQGLLDGFEIKDLYVTVKDEIDSKVIENFSTKIFGGSIHGSFTIDKTTNFINSTSFAVKNIILKDYPNLTKKYTLNAPVVSVSNSVVAIPAMDLYFGQLNGKLSNLKVQDGDLSFVFNGRAGEISKPNMGISTDDNTISISNDNKLTTLKLNGRYINSNFELLCKFKATENEGTKLFIDKFSLSNGRIDLTEDNINKIRNSLVALDTKLESFNTNNVEFVSNIDSFPLTVKSVDIEGDSIRFGNDRYIKEGKFTVNLNSGYYKDLFFKQLKLKTKFTLDNTLFNIENLTFVNSSLSSVYNYNNKLNTITFKLKASDFDLSELNSDLIARLVNGKVNIDINLYTDESEPKLSYVPEYTGISFDYLKNEDLFLKLKGIASIKSDEILISGFGLDLLNGGKEGEYKFSLQSLLDALKESDCGLYKLDSTISFENGVAKLDGKTDLTASKVKAYGDYNFLSDTLNLHALLTTFTKGNRSAFHITGKRSSVEYTLKSIKREEVRNGLLLVPAISEEDLEKEQDTPLDNTKTSKDTEKEDTPKPPVSTVIEDKQESVLKENNDKTETEPNGSENKGSENTQEKTLNTKAKDDSSEKETKTDENTTQTSSETTKEDTDKTPSSSDVEDLEKTILDESKENTETIDTQKKVSEDTHESSSNTKAKDEASNKEHKAIQIDHEELDKLEEELLQ